MASCVSYTSFLRSPLSSATLSSIIVYVFFVCIFPDISVGLHFIFILTRIRKCTFCFSSQTTNGIQSFYPGVFPYMVADGLSGAVKFATFEVSKIFLEKKLPVKFHPSPFIAFLPANRPPKPSNFNV